MTTTMSDTLDLAVRTLIRQFGYHEVDPLGLAEDEAVMMVQNGAITFGTIATREEADEWYYIDRTYIRETGMAVTSTSAPRATWQDYNEQTRGKLAVTVYEAPAVKFYAGPIIY